MLTSEGPHHTNIGKCEFRQMLTAMRRLCGHCCGGPSGVAAQSMLSSRRAVGEKVGPEIAGSPSRSGCGLEGGWDMAAKSTKALATAVQAKGAFRVPRWPAPVE